MALANTSARLKAGYVPRPDSLPYRPAPHPLAIGAYRWFWFARILAMLGQSNFVVTLGWAVYDTARMTHDMRGASLRIGLIGLAQFVPVLLLNPVAGLAADRFDRRHVARLSVLGQMIATGSLTLAAFASFDGSPGGLGVLYAAAVAFAASRAFYMPSMNALGPSLVPVEVLPRAIAISAVGGRIGGIMGPVIGGYAYGLGGSWAFALTTLLLGGALLAQMAIAAPLRPVERATGHPWINIVAGLRYVVRSRMLLGAISLDLVAVLFGGATALLPVFARDILLVGPGGLGLLRAASPVGAVGTALWLTSRPISSGVGAKLLIAVAIYGLASTVFGLSTSLWLSLAMLGLAGAADMVSVFVRQTLVQVVTPDAMRGRVGAISSLFITASNELGEMESGLAAAWLGPIGAVVAGGLIATATAWLWGWIFPELRRVSRFGELSADHAARPAAVGAAVVSGQPLNGPTGNGA